MRISDWSSDVCSSGLAGPGSVGGRLAHAAVTSEHSGSFLAQDSASLVHFMDFWAIDRMNDRNLIGMDGGFREQPMLDVLLDFGPEDLGRREMLEDRSGHRETAGNEGARDVTDNVAERSEEHTSELPSLMRKPDAVFCLKKKI